MELGDQLSLDLVHWVKDLGHERLANQLLDAHNHGSFTQQKRLADAYVLSHTDISQPTQNEGVMTFLSILEEMLKQPAGLSPD